MPITVLNRMRAGGSRAFDADVLSWRDAVLANGGFVSLARLVIVDQFVFSEKAAGTWALTDDYWGLWAENAAQALTSLKQRRLGTAVNSPTFTPDRGYAGDGSTSYIDTGFNPSVHAVAMTPDSVRLVAYERTYVGGSGCTAGVNSTANRALSIRSAGASMAANGTAATFSVSLPGVGMIVSARRGPLVSDQVGFKNAISQARSVDAPALGTSLPVLPIFVNAVNNSGSPALFRATQVGFLAAGAALSDAQELAQYSNVQAWASSVGAQV